jgi:LAGLIDADG DNA endonuclease family
LIIYYTKSTKGVKRLSKDERISIFLPENVEEVLTGILLSDGHLQQRSVSSNARLIFNQSGKVDKRPYFELVYNIFKFCYIDNSEYYIKT